MCGIIACRTNRPTTDYLSIALRRLEYRGYDTVGGALQTASSEVARLRTVGRVAALDSRVREWPGGPFNGVMPIYPRVDVRDHSPVAEAGSSAGWLAAAHDARVASYRPWNDRG
jgi:hypothetical protein